MPPRIPQPWLNFLREIDRALGRPIEVHCLGGFVLGVLHELPRPTGDIDFVEIAPSGADEELLGIAGEGSEIADRYGLQFHRVTIAEYPESYQQHVARGSHVLLFARLRQSDRPFWFLGPGTYLRHEGERPMAVTWRLHQPLPGDLFATFAAVAGA